MREEISGSLELWVPNERFVALQHRCFEPKCKLVDVVFESAVLAGMEAPAIVTKAAAWFLIDELLATWQSAERGLYVVASCCAINLLC